MGKINSIPLIFGVTGHRDLREEDLGNLEESIQALFLKYKTKYNHTELIVISALAEGADMLVARVAKKLNITLHILLPYQEEDYLNSFMDKEKNVDEFNTLKSYATSFKVNSCVDTYGHETCYQQLGEKIADDSNILIALWDGVDNGKLGGTSAIVKYQCTGFEENRFDAIDGNALFVITTPRKSNSEVKTDFTVKSEFLGKYIKDKNFENMLTKIDKLNAKMNVETRTEGSLLKYYMNYFDKTAGENQAKFKNYSKAILLFTFIAITCLEIMHVMHWDNAIIGYGVGLLFAFGLYHFFMHKGGVQDDFVYSRGFTEAIRVQNAWNAAELNKSVAQYYLKDQHHKFTWLKTILKNLAYRDNIPFTPTYDKGSTPEDWIDGQITYFKNAVDIRHKKFERLEMIEKVFYKMALVVLIAMFTIYTLESLHIVDHGALWVNWHYLVLASGLLLLVAAFIGEKYIKIEGYEEEIYHFNAMLTNFKDAKEALILITKGNETYQKIVYDLGLKALEENSKWVVLHDSMRLKPSLD